jgi:hypothetical protein
MRRVTHRTPARPSTRTHRRTGRRAQPLCAAIVRGDLHGCGSSTDSTVPTTTTYLYTDGSTVELHELRPLWNTARHGRIQPSRTDTRTDTSLDTSKDHPS